MNVWRALISATQLIFDMVVRNLQFHTNSFENTCPGRSMKFLMPEGYDMISVAVWFYRSVLAPTDGAMCIHMQICVWNERHRHILSTLNLAERVKYLETVRERRRFKDHSIDWMTGNITLLDTLNISVCL